MSCSVRPNLLYLGHNLPYPPHEGALIRSYHTVRLLSEAFNVAAVYFYRKGTVDCEGDKDASLERLGNFGQALAHPISQEYSTRRLIADHLRSLVTSRPYTFWMHQSRAFKADIQQIQEERRIDIVHVDSLDLLAYLPLLSAYPVVLSHHNIESSLLRRRAMPETLIKRSYIRHQAKLIELAERTWAPRVQLNVTVSEADAAHLRALAPGADVVVIPNGVDTSEFVPQTGETSGGIIFVGGYSWFPNHDGMAHFAHEILPLIRRTHPSVRVRWIGKAPDEAVKRFAALGVEMLGYVEDIRPVVGTARCAIVPLRVGGGTRLKILDAWAMGKAVVSTPLGAEGLQCRHGENILLAESPEAFADAIRRVLDDPNLRARLEHGARATAVGRYDWEQLGQRMHASYEKVLRRWRQMPEVTGRTHAQGP